MGCASSKPAAGQGKSADPNPQSAGPPPVSVGDLVLVRNAPCIGTVTSYEPTPRKSPMNHDKVQLTEVGKEGRSRKVDLKDWAKVADVAEIKDFAPSMEVTVEYRGAKVNGWITNCKKDGDLTIKFLPDEAADKVDKTHWALGATHVCKKEDCTPGHSGAERPRVRNEEEIEEDKKKWKNSAVTYLHCGRCGRAVWEDPCDCYVNRSAGFACAKCGTKHATKEAECCREKLKDNKQNMGWVNELGNQYGRFIA